MPSSTFYATLEELEKMRQQERSDNKIDLGLGRETLYGKNADNYRALQSLALQNEGNLALGEQKNLGALNLQNATNQGEYAKQNLANIGLINRQELENANKIATQGLANTNAINLAKIEAANNRAINNSKNDTASIIAGMQYGIGGSEDRRTNSVAEQNRLNRELQSKELDFKPIKDELGNIVDYQQVNKYQQPSVLESMGMNSNYSTQPKVDPRAASIEKFKSYTAEQAPAISKYMASLNQSDLADFVSILKETGNTELLNALFKKENNPLTGGNGW